MSERVKWIQHKGKSILFCDFAGLNEAQYLDGVAEMEAELLKQPAGTNVLMLIDVAGSRMSAVTRDRGKETVAVVEKAGITTNTVLSGITGLQKIIAQAISRDVHFENDIESAKEWLVSQ